MDDETIAALVKKIGEEMEHQLLTQTELARRAGISRQRVHDLLRGRTKAIPTIKVLLITLKLWDPYAKS